MVFELSHPNLREDSAIESAARLEIAKYDAHVSENLVFPNGSINHISRLNAASVPDATTCVTKCLRYATKDLSGQCYWPQGTRRYGASRKAHEQMGGLNENPDW
jgi:hypothetical protein